MLVAKNYIICINKYENVFKEDLNKLLSDVSVYSNLYFIL